MVDLITTEVIRSKFQALLGEMRFLLIRSAYSSLMRESRDCGMGICSPDGHMPFEGASNWLFMYGLAARRILAKFPLKDLHEGDVFIGNDPYDIGAPHSPDVLVMTPVLSNGGLVGFCGSVAHKMDFGGAVPGSIYSGATEVFQEGLRLPIVKYYDRGKVVPQVEALIQGNVRNADLVLGDLGAQVGATLVGATRIRKLSQRYGEETLVAAFEELLAAPERRISRVVEKWPGREAEAETLLDPPPNHDKPVRLHVRATRDGGHLTFDFSQSDPQVRAPVNIPSSVLLHLCGVCLIGMTDPDVGEQAGVARAFTFVTKEGTVANPTPPAPVGNTTMVQPAYIDIMLSALATLKGQGAVASRGGHGTTALGWRDPGLVKGRKYVQYEIQSSAIGATSWCDGISGVNPLSYQYRYTARLLDNPTLQETPVEILEASFPVRVRRYELLSDSGGAGKFRGGVSPRRMYEALVPADLNVRHAISFAIPAKGADGGRPGKKGRVVVNLGTPSEAEAKGWSFELKPGDTMSFEGGGGGGVGNPQERDLKTVLEDVADGYVTVEAARDDYRVAIRTVQGKLTVDEEATRRLRSGAATREKVAARAPKGRSSPKKRR